MNNKTQIQQRQVENAYEATEVFNAEHDDTIPIVLVPESRFCCSCFYRVPSGVYAIVHHCGDDAYPRGFAPAGLHCCKPYWNHVAFLVTQQMVTYNAPVKVCPTKDNVMVDCQLTLVFSIGPKTEDVKNFVYKLGAVKFNDFLAAEAEENIRQLVRATPLFEVYELRGSSSKQVAEVLKTLNSKFAPFGVTFAKAAITDVMLSDELRRILQGTTEFKTKIRELEKEHEHNMKTITYDFEKKVSEKERFYDRKMQDIDAEIAVALLSREKEKVNAESRREVAKTKAEEQASVEKQRAEAQLKVSAVKAKQENEELLTQSRVESESRKVKVDKECEMKIYESQQQIKIHENKANALLTEAKAEGQAADALKVIRDHNLQMAKMEVCEEIAKKAKMVISGDNGDKLIASILDKESLIQRIHKTN